MGTSQDFVLEIAQSEVSCPSLSPHIVGTPWLRRKQGAACHMEGSKANARHQSFLGYH